MSHLRLKVGAPPARKGDVTGSVIVSFAGEASSDNSAQIGELSKMETATPGSAYIVINASPQAVIIIDGLYLKNVIVTNATVEYDGGPSRLKNVYFVNCEFVSPLTPNGRDLGKTILTSASTTFSTTSANQTPTTGE